MRALRVHRRLGEAAALRTTARASTEGSSRRGRHLERDPLSELRLRRRQLVARLEIEPEPRAIAEVTSGRSAVSGETPLPLTMSVMRAAKLAGHKWGFKHVSPQSRRRERGEQVLRGLLVHPGELALAGLDELPRRAVRPARSIREVYYVRRRYEKRLDGRSPEFDRASRRA